ncbi:hypothetical protein [Halomonas elongata]|uniref:Uncharacterized protein n=2 Tax=Halomonas elongata TaxID=2746 RepID=E1V7R9_HALED|nr:hypothetical protein [Halomonas elongata]MBW5799412.1 hypothetical protein [Halomonas elongata]MDL4862260.1 hypothetical protein [Halomonas elongata]RAW06409.1 hypothetical protein DKQ62_14145 [Halomonas elongata]WBF17252.1 hypothetical protein LM502_14370 [Halomonas elongata]WPU46088.1 hypothetical protein SR933_12600 [Halomonas elongata DSM 2581]
MLRLIATPQPMAGRLEARALVRHTLFATCLGLMMAGFDTADAQDIGLRNSTVLQGGALSHVSGVANTNMAAGEGNRQANSGALSIGRASSTSGQLVQQARIDESLISLQNDVQIQDKAFRQASGWMSINQAAGQGNVQSNAFGMALGINVSSLDDRNLQQVLASQQGLNGGGDDSAEDASRRVEIDNTTFGGARGVIQVNQSAGKGNATRNSFRMNMALGQ